MLRIRVVVPAKLQQTVCIMLRIRVVVPAKLQQTVCIKD